MSGMSIQYLCVSSVWFIIGFRVAAGISIYFYQKK